jgi:putative nucleotidyltransferase with HDIG domain
MITHQEALALLKRYIDDEKIIKHCLGVADIAYELASKIKRKNLVPIDVDKVEIAALLHDIGKYYKEGMHEFHSVDVLKKEGLHDIAELVMHGFIHEIFVLKMDEEATNYVPRTIENKMVALADMYYNQNEQRVSLDERLADIIKRYKNDKTSLQAVRLGKKRFKKLEAEIFTLM